MSTALPSQAPVGVPSPRPFLTPVQINSSDKRLPGGACIPPELEQWKFKILLAGKYLNVIRACGLELAEDAEAQIFDANKEMELGSDE
jgi:gamma-tubulin complex component 2